MEIIITESAKKELRKIKKGNSKFFDLLMEKIDELGKNSFDEENISIKNLRAIQIFSDNEFPIIASCLNPVQKIP